MLMELRHELLPLRILLCVYCMLTQVAHSQVSFACKLTCHAHEGPARRAHGVHLMSGFTSCLLLLKSPLVKTCGCASCLIAATHSLPSLTMRSPPLPPEVAPQGT